MNKNRVGCIGGTSTFNPKDQKAKGNIWTLLWLPLSSRIWVPGDLEYQNARKEIHESFISTPYSVTKE